MLTAYDRLERALEDLISVLRDGSWWGNREAYLLSRMPFLTMENYSTRLDHLLRMEEDGLTHCFKGVWSRTELGDEVLQRRRPDGL